MTANMSVPAVTRPGSPIPPARAASAASDAALASTARARPATRRAVTTRAAGSPEITSRRSVPRAADVRKNIAIADKNPAAQPAVAVCTAPPPAAAPPEEPGGLGEGSGCYHHEHHWHQHDEQQVDRVARVVGQESSYRPRLAASWLARVIA
jgi:hypothetical protein